MIERAIQAKFEAFDLPGVQKQDFAVAVTTASGTKFSRYGEHAYYFLNFKSKKGLCVKVSHRDIIFPGLKQLAEANYKRYRFFSRLSLLFQSYHYGFNFLEQIMLMTVPHTVTDVGSGKFIISFWSYFGYLEVDLKKGTVVYRMMNETDGHHVFGSMQWYAAESDSLYYMNYSLKDSLKKAINPHEKVFSKILEHENRTGETKEIWSGYFSDYMHDLLISGNKRYLVACELGRFSDKNGMLIPSKVLILNLESKKEWIGSIVDNSAHAQFDLDDSEIIYLSNHNFQFLHTPFRELFKKGAYTLKFLGPASVHKFRITSDGPKEIGVFSQQDLFRLTNFHVFKHRGRKIIAAMGAPNFIFIADADEMRLIKKIEVKNLDATSYIGTIVPSYDGEKLYIQTTRSFQIFDIESEKTNFIRSYDFNHTCSNHMMVSKNTDW